MLGTDADLSTAVRDLLATQLSAAACEALDGAKLRSRPDAAALVIDGHEDPLAALAVARHARAMGFAGGLIVLGNCDDAALAPLGAAKVSVDRMAHELVPALATTIEWAASPFADQVMRGRRLVAAGEIALGLQHAFNNPLAGLLAELQVMRMDTLAPDHGEAVDRMLALCRRLVELTRQMDGLGERKHN